jgi:hypothetical protein
MANTKVPVELFDAGAGFTIGSGAEEDIKLIFDGNATDYYIGLRDSGDKFVVGKGQTLGTDQVFEISDGASAKPQVGVGSGGTNPMSLTYTGTALAVSDSSGTASVQVSGGNAARMDFGIGSSAKFRVYTDASNYTEFKRTTDHPIIFAVNSAETARLTSSGMQFAASKDISNASGDFTLDIAGDITFDADGGTIFFKDGGTEMGQINLDNSGFFDIYTSVQDADFRIRGNDGGSTVTALTLDMSNSGDAVFRRQVTLREALYINTADNSATTGYLYDDSGDFVLRSFTQDKDIVFKGNDGGSIITPLRIDMSTGGRALFASDLLALETAGQYLQMKGSGSTYWAIGSTGGTNEPGTASTSLAFHHYDGSAWNNEVEFDSSGNIVADGNITAFSDVRLKDNIETIENGLAKVNELRGVSYSKDNKKSIGVIAQEVEKVLPEIVITGKTEEKLKSVDYGRLTAVLIEAVKELSARVKELEGK